MEETMYHIYQQGFRYGQRYRQQHPSPLPTSEVPAQLAGIQALAYLRDHSPDARHQFIRGFLEGYRRATPR